MTPGCTLCGYAVEVVRSCFRSRWRLFRGRPETTAGVYVFADDSTPCYPGWHNYWSRDWVSDELDGAELGEDPAATRGYSLGAPLGWIPAPQLIGDADCIANGERWPLAVKPTIDAGFDARCPEQVAAPRVDLDPTNPTNWCFWSQVAELVYRDPTAARLQVATALGVAPTGYVQQEQLGTTPQFFALTPPRPLPVVIVIAGTSTVEQWLAQIQYGARPPTGFGVFATLPFWNGVVDYILGKLLPLAIPTLQDVIIVGHSMGGAVASVLAARLRIGQPLRRIQLLTLGSPRAGDARLYGILASTDMVNLQNDGDVVLSIPVNLFELPLTLQILVQQNYPPGSLLWAVQPARYRVSWEGLVEQGAGQPGENVPTLAVVFFFWLHINIPDFSPHLQQEYERRLCRAAQAPVVWLDSWDLNQDNAALVAVWPNKVDPLWSAHTVLSPATPQMALSIQRWDRAVRFDNVDVLQLAKPAGTTAAWSYYAVVQIVWPTVNFNTSKRRGVPTSVNSGGAVTEGEWQGPGLSGAGWTVTVAGVVANVPWPANDAVPTLVAVYWDKGTLRIYLESVGDVAASASGSPGDASWQYVGGHLGALQPFPTASLLLGELLYFEQLLSSADDGSILDYLRIKWLNRGQVITTESGDWITTESGDPIITE